MNTTIRLLTVFLFIILLAACGKSDKKEDSQVTTTTQEANSPSAVDHFSEVLNDATEYSYTVVYSSTDDGETMTMTYGYAKQGANEALSMNFGDDTGTSIFLTTANYDYYISINGEEKQAYKYTKGDSSSNITPPDLGFITDFDDTYYKYQNKTEDVMVGNEKTTCYEYKYLTYVYKYYVLDNGIIVKVEWTYGNTSSFYVEIKDFKTSNIDTTLLTIPTEEAGYTISDLTGE